jgi:TolB-like protein
MKPVLLVVFVVLIVPWGLASAQAAPVVAVMPFRDLSESGASALSAGGARNSVGEAIRETVTTDLKEVPDLTVVERGAIDKILEEQHLQSSRFELDPLSTVKVGKLLGASLIVTGAYQRAASAVRLTARFVKVETGEVIGTAKVDGNSSDFLQLQDRITVELLRSAGMKGSHVEKFTRRSRPKLKSLKAVELYGDAVAESNDEKKVEILKLALNEDPGFEYAARDLDALEKRLKSLEKVQRVAEDKKLDELRKQMAAESDPEKRRQLEGQVAGQLMSSRRWFELRHLARNTKVGSDGAAFYLVQTDYLLHDWDAVLRDGEQFLNKYPASIYFTAIKGMMEQTITKKRKAAEGKTSVGPELAKVEGDRRWNLCQFGWTYRNHEQHAEARRFLRACLDVGTGAPKDILPQLIVEDLECADLAQAKKDLAELRKIDADRAHGYEGMLPSDG